MFSSCVMFSPIYLFIYSTLEFWACLSCMYIYIHIIYWLHPPGEWLIETHYITHNHTLPDFQVVSKTTNSFRNMCLVALRHMTDENNICSKICKTCLISSNWIGSHWPAYTTWFSAKSVNSISGDWLAS